MALLKDNIAHQCLLRVFLGLLNSLCDNSWSGIPNKHDTVAELVVEFHKNVSRLKNLMRVIEAEFTNLALYTYWTNDLVISSLYMLNKWFSESV